MKATLECNCLKCKHFSSFASIYEDELEPDDVGWCYEGESQRTDISPDGEDTVFSDDYLCSKFQKNRQIFL